MNYSGSKLRTKSIAAIAQQFEAVFGQQPTVFSAPGRVNLIGEHTDYNDGFVMPCAIDYWTRVAIAPRPDGKIHIRSVEFSQSFEFDSNALPPARLGSWPDYVLGVANMMKQANCPLAGANLLVAGEVPMGAGLSSSAALEVASALALSSLSGIRPPLRELARLCQRAENQFVGARVGIMDQFATCFGRAGCALLLDCRSLDFKLISLPRNIRLIICNTMVKHEHASGGYNRRRSECEAGVKLLSEWYPEVRALRDVSASQLESHSKEIPTDIYQRCCHVVEENERVLNGGRWLAEGNLGRFGEAMRASHRSLRELYQVSCPELDLMVNLAEDLPGYYGGRMTGGGFGGCTVNLVEVDDSEAFASQISEHYYKATRIEPDIYICSAADGAATGISETNEW
jgi:galactokinase